MTAGSHQDFYAPTFSKNLKKYAHLSKKLEKLTGQITSDPFVNTEQLDYKEGRDLRGLRSARIDRNFRVIFCILEEYKNKTTKTLPLLPHAMQETLPENAVVFLTVGPHEKAYRLQ